MSITVIIINNRTTLSGEFGSVLIVRECIDTVFTSKYRQILIGVSLLLWHWKITSPSPPTCTYTHSHTHTHTYRDRQAYIQLYTHTCTQTQMHTDTDRPTYTCTHTYTHQAWWWVSSQWEQCMDGTSQATAWFHDSDIFQKAVKMALGCILSVNSHLSGFKL